MNLIPKIIVVLGLVLLLCSFMLPAVRLTDDILLNGAYAFVINAAMLFYVESAAEYFEYVFSVLTNVWAFWLFVRFWRRSEMKILTYIIVLLAVSSAGYWYFKMEDTSVLLYGFWVWVAGVLTISLANLLKRRSAV